MRHPVWIVPELFHMDKSSAYLCINCVKTKLKPSRPPANIRIVYQGFFKCNVSCGHFVCNPIFQITLAQTCHFEAIVGPRVVEIPICQAFWSKFRRFLFPGALTIYDNMGNLNSVRARQKVDDPYLIVGNIIQFYELKTKHKLEVHWIFRYELRIRIYNEWQYEIEYPRCYVHPPMTVDENELVDVHDDDEGTNEEELPLDGVSVDHNDTKEESMPDVLALQDVRGSVSLPNSCSSTDYTVVDLFKINSILELSHRLASTRNGLLCCIVTYFVNQSMLPVLPLMGFAVIPILASKIWLCRGMRKLPDLSRDLAKVIMAWLVYMARTNQLDYQSYKNKVNCRFLPSIGSESWSLTTGVDYRGMEDWLAITGL
ncbi:hypothetical protein VNO77_42313 [Canavalia gladiata]|uniref:Uncharacterized protein n=1 Tax=Canavalia gladiata TaxID=3824 RepID=A0AAN9PQW8_CANGL